MKRGGDDEKVRISIQTHNNDSACINMRGIFLESTTRMDPRRKSLPGVAGSSCEGVSRSGGAILDTKGVAEGRILCTKLGLGNSWGRLV